MHEWLSECSMELKLASADAAKFLLPYVVDKYAVGRQLFGNERKRLCKIDECG
jgi:hypothetical protein